MTICSFNIPFRDISIILKGTPVRVSHTHKLSRQPHQKILFIYFNLRLSDSNLVCEVVPIDACRFPKRQASVAG